MRRDLTIKTASLTGTSDLTIVASIKKGLVPSLDAVTYKTRVKRVLKTLHLGRAAAHEYEFARVLSDAVERVGRIHSIRIAILEPEDKVMLAVTFDGSWESYIRVIWQKVSRSLDLIFCNTDGYVTGWDHTFEEWCAWLRKSQAETSFLYSPPGLSYQDTQYLRSYERRLRVDADLGGADLAATRIRIPSAEEISDQLGAEGTDPTNLGLDEPLDLKTAGRPAFRQGVKGLAGLYRLADVHLPGTDDGAILHRAAAELLREFLPMVKTASGRIQYQKAIEFAELRFLDALDWLRDTAAPDRPVPTLPEHPPRDEFDDVQGGILESYPDTSDGCLLFLGFDSSQDLGHFLARVQPTSATNRIGKGDIALNVALTLEGMRLAGLTDDEVNVLPEEFAQGMERRAGMLGDVRTNHPRRWRRPALNGAQGVAAPDVAQDDPCDRVDLSSVHLVLQLRICNTREPTSVARALLWDRFGFLTTEHPGLRLLSIQWMHRLTTDDGKVREHFGFLDSQSEPTLETADEGKKYRNHVHLGEILLGYDNAADAAPAPSQSSDVQKLLRNGSFLVVRKLRQDVEALETALQSAVDTALPDDQTADQVKDREQYRDLLLAKMMGRWPAGSADAGKALATSFGKHDNDFSYDRDRQGARCPFHAHIRRANPRDESQPEPPGARPARLIRRGMSYGPLHDPKATGESQAESLAEERGLVFMAYNASIGEQFEVVQRWLTGGNSSGSYSGQSDPFLGIAEPGRPRVFRFEHDDAAIRISLDGSPRMHDDPRPLVRLEWGMYLFTPSIPTLRTLAGRAAHAGTNVTRSWSAGQGTDEISRLRGIEQVKGSQAAFDAWKAAIEDPATAADFTAASIWAAIRERHGGVLRTPLGVLVASRQLVDEVLHDRDRNLTATGYLPRMQRSFGPLFLGMDAGQIDGAYERESVDVNAAIMGLTATPADFGAAVAEASRATVEAIEVLKRQAIDYATKNCETHWEVTFEAREIIDEVLSHFCEKWFGLADGEFLQRSGVRWNWKAGERPCYPGHFMAPSRYTFQPHPGADVERLGSQHGLALRVAITDYLAAHGASLAQPVARAALDSKAAQGDPSYPARTLAGVLMGFLPTTDGNMRRALNEWLNEGTLWSLRARHSTCDPTDAAAQKALAHELRRKLGAAMQLRAAPELLWRTAATSHAVGKAGPNRVAVRPGEMVIASLISATHECLEQGDPSLAYAFGGHRDPTATHPTHACPGYGPAQAVILGFFKGLVESKELLRPGPAALTFAMEGYLELSRACKQKSLAFEEFSLEIFRTKPIPLLTIGDSWLFAFVVGPFEVTPSLSTELHDLNYSSSNEFCKIGKTLAELAHQTALDRLGAYLAKLDGEPDAPKAILIGGGGNDLVDPPGAAEKTKLFGMLNQGALTPATALNEAATKAFIDVELMGHYRKILKTVTAGTTAPILIHAYDHPIPDGVPSDHGPGPWLQPVFMKSGIAEGARRKTMETLIERLNAMVIEVAKEFPGRVHHVKLSGELAKQADFQQNYRKYWANELHATDTGFDILAKVVQAKLVSLGVR